MAKLKFTLPPKATWHAGADAETGKPVHEVKNGDVIECELGADGKPTDALLQEAVAAGIAAIEK